MKSRISALLLVFLATTVAPAQTLLYTGGTIYSEDFNSPKLSDSPGVHAWLGGVTPLPGWHAASVHSGILFFYRADDGSTNIGDLYSYGTNFDPDRALGTAASNATGEMYFGVGFTNDSDFWTLTSFSVEFTVEQWRDASEDASFLEFEYRVFASGMGSIDALGVWNSIVGLPNVRGDNAGALDGNDPANKYSVSLTVPIVGGWAPGHELWLRWRDPNDPGSDHGLAIDDFSFSAVPEPTTFILVGLGMGATGWTIRRNRRKSVNHAAA